MKTNGTLHELALAFAERHRHDLRYVAARRQWHLLEGVNRKPDTTLKVLNLARIFAREAAAGHKPSVEKKLRSVGTRDAIVRMARKGRLAADLPPSTDDPR